MGYEGPLSMSELTEVFFYKNAKEPFTQGEYEDTINIGKFT